MGVFFFYNNRKPPKYGYKPILYNPEKEERDNRLAQRILDIKREMGVLPEEEVQERTDFKSEFLAQTSHLKKRKDREASGGKAFFTNNGLLLVILLALFVIFVLWLLGMF
jgi:hypothetical protein